jgi:hypothetical protein
MALDHLRGELELLSLSLLTFQPHFTHLPLKMAETENGQQISAGMTHYYYFHKPYTDSSRRDRAL